MRKLADKSVDMILCDLPYGTTACKWDTIIPFEPLWEEYHRVIKDNGAIVLTASQPFTSALIMSNIKNFKYCWVWDKVAVANPMLAKIMPLKIHEDVCVFYKKKPLYNPIMTEGKSWSRGGRNGKLSFAGKDIEVTKAKSDTTSMRYPKSIITFSNANRTKNVHPTQKPVPLFEYLILTYSNEGDVILDNCIGSGTTAIAAINTGRQFIGIERETEYCEIARQRIEDALQTVGDRL